MSKSDELFEKISNQLIEAIENGEPGQWKKPWQSIVGHGMPTNVVTKKAYRGFNVLAFWMAQEDGGFESSLWATYKQWQSIGAQVRKGEAGTKGQRWGVSYVCENGCKKGPKPCGIAGHAYDKRIWGTVFTVFNADQVDGFDAPKVEDLGDGPEALAEVEAFIAATGANITHKAGDRAFWKINTNEITVPLREQFETQQGYYGTVLHEITHWTGGDDRLGRSQSGVFGSNQYAAEELIAELGSAFLAAHFGIEAVPHVEHAAYLKGWAKTLRDDPKAIYKAAKAAQEAVEYLLEMTADRMAVEAA